MTLRHRLNPMVKVDCETSLKTVASWQWCGKITKHWRKSTGVVQAVSVLTLISTSRRTSALYPEHVSHHEFASQVVSTGGSLAPPMFNIPKRRGNEVYLFSLLLIGLSEPRWALRADPRPRPRLLFRPGARPLPLVAEGVWLTGAKPVPTACKAELTSFQ